MSSRIVRLITHFAALFCCLSLSIGLLGLPSAGAGAGLRMPWSTRVVTTTSETITNTVAENHPSELVSALVHINMAPLAMVGKEWTHQQRLDYVAQIRAAQDALIPQIETLGGVVVGRFTHLSTGLAIQIDVQHMDALSTLTGVLAVRQVTNFTLNESNVPAWVGATQAREKLAVDGQGINVALIDTGVDYTHAKLGGAGSTAAYRTAYCGNPTTVPDPTDPTCIAQSNPPDPTVFPNSKVKGGYDWVGDRWPNPDPICYRSTPENPVACTLPDTNPIDFAGHGTHVADIIAGLESAPGAGDQGIAPGANLWAYKACSAVANVCDGLAVLFAMDDALDLDNSDFGACTPGVSPNCRTYDPADVINLSIGNAYGQPEDSLTMFADMASYYGSLVVIAAGNSGDRPYIVSAPATAAGAIAVGQSTTSDDRLYPITAAGTVAQGLLQTWSTPLSTTLNGLSLQYGDGAGGNLDGCAPFAPVVSTTALLVDRGTCNVSEKAAHATTAGAGLVLIADTQLANTQPIFGYGGGTVGIPALTLLVRDGNTLRAKLATTPVVPVSVTGTPSRSLADEIVASSSRGPRIADGAIKPDMVAPGAINSAAVGTGSSKTSFGGTSGSAPVVAGTAALVIQSLQQRGIVDREPGLGSATGPTAFVPVVKSLLMNAAFPNTTIGGSFLAPITLQGAGRVDALAATQLGTSVLDTTDLTAYLGKGNAAAPCTVTPAVDVILFTIFGRNPQCALYPAGNDYFNAWNAQTGSISFGYTSVASSYVETRTLTLVNLEETQKSYQLSNGFRYSDDLNRGVTISISPTKLVVPAKSAAPIQIRMTVNASKLRDWTLDAGQFGASGTDITCNNPDPNNGCPTFQMFEVDGLITIDGGANNLVRMPWQVLPRKAAQPSIVATYSGAVQFGNQAKAKPADVDVFSLLEVSPNNCEITGPNGCSDQNYAPGIMPGTDKSPVDIHEVGVRSTSVPGMNTQFTLPQAPSGATADELVAFGITVYDIPFRASHNFPVRFEVHVDNNRDGVYDYIVFNADLNLDGSDGRNAVFVEDVNPADGTRPLRSYFFSTTDFNSQNWILSVPAAAIGTVSSAPFNFYVLAYDASFGGVPGYDGLWDCSPYVTTGTCGSVAHTYQTGLPKYRPITTAFQIRSKYRLSFNRPSMGASASPSQIGLLFLYRDPMIGHESDNYIVK